MEPVSDQHRDWGTVNDWCRGRWTRFKFQMPSSSVATLWLLLLSFLRKRRDSKSHQQVGKLNSCTGASKTGWSNVLPCLWWYCKEKTSLILNWILQWRRHVGHPHNLSCCAVIFWLFFFGASPPSRPHTFSLHPLYQSIFPPHTPQFTSLPL